MSEVDERQLAEFHADGDPFDEIISTDGELPEDYIATTRQRRNTDATNS